MLVIGGQRSLWDSLITVALAAEQQLSSQHPGSVPAMVLGGVAGHSLAADKALALLAEGRADVMDFHAMLKEVEERKGYRSDRVPVQPMFYGGSRVAGLRK